METVGAGPLSSSRRRARALAGRERETPQAHRVRVGRARGGKRALQAVAGQAVARGAF